ncbi:hypothetical protein D3C87_651260 [compost metagenome]
MATSAEGTGDRMGVHLAAGANGDLDGSVGKLLEEEPDLGLADLGKLGEDQVGFLDPRAAGGEHGLGDGGPDEPSVEVFLEVAQGHAHDAEGTGGELLVEVAVDAGGIGSGVDQPGGEAIGLGVGLVDDEAAGVVEHAGVESGGDRRIHLNAQFDAEPGDHLGGGGGGLVHPGQLGEVGVVEVVVDVQPDGRQLGGRMDPTGIAAVEDDGMPAALGGGLLGGLVVNGKEVFEEAAIKGHGLGGVDPGFLAEFLGDQGQPDGGPQGIRIGVDVGNRDQPVFLANCLGGLGEGKTLALGHGNLLESRGPQRPGPAGTRRRRVFTTSEASSACAKE